MKLGKFEMDGGLISVSLLLILTFLTIYFAFKYDTMLKIEQEKTKQLELQVQLGGELCYQKNLENN